VVMVVVFEFSGNALSAP
ncbi:hypothetical protein VCHC44C1_3361C, partial [Vibrio cholerae HC-44C1]